MASRFIHDIISSSCLCPTSKSLGSCAGVIFTTPVPNSGSTYSSAINGISLLTSGKITFLPTIFLYLSSSGLTAMAISPNIVSGLEVAITISSPFSSAAGYLKYQYIPLLSSCSTSASEREVPQLGHQLISLFPL